MDPDTELQELLDTICDLEESTARSHLNAHLRGAIQRGNVAPMRELFAQGAGRSLEPVEAAQYLISAIASKNASEGMLSLLLSSGFPAHCVDDHLGEHYQTTPFMAAAKAGRLDLAKLLLKAGADPHWKNPQGSNAASEVIPSSSVQDRCNATPERAAVAAWLEELGVRMDPASEDSRRRPFYASYTKNSWPDIPGHLARGIDPACLRWTPFMIDVALGQATVEEAAGLSPDELQHRDAWKRTPFLLAVVAGRRDLVEALLKAGADPFATGHCETGALRFAARENHAALIPWLLELGCGVDSQDEFGDTALITAAGENSIDAVRALLDAGANIGKVHEDGDEAIHAAWSQEIIAMLLAAGANVNSISRCGHWPLKVAASQGNSSFVTYLLQAGANPNLTASNETALFDAVRSDSLECVRLLLDAGADINADDCDGWTCLRYADSVPMARYLLSRGADPAIPDQGGEVPETANLAPEIAAIYREHRLRIET